MLLSGLLLITMGMLLSIPMALVGAGAIVLAARGYTRPARPVDLRLGHRHPRGPGALMGFAGLSIGLSALLVSLSSDRSSTIGMTRCRYAVRYV